MAIHRAGRGRAANGAEAAAGSVRPSVVTLPDRRPQGVETLLDFFLLRFPRIPEAVWRQRFADGKVWSGQGAVAADEPFAPAAELRYRREVEREPAVRSDFRVVQCDEDLVVVDKPPHLPVTPGGPWVRSCLLHMLSTALSTDELVPVHRIDRLTSGVVVFSRRRATRSLIAGLFQPGSPVEKVYTAVCETGAAELPQRALLEHHVARSPDQYWRQVSVRGAPPNARCTIELLASDGGLALYRVRPQTGRKHQLRVQLAAAGLPVLGDPLYGNAPFHDPEDLATRMWLDAHILRVRRYPRPESGGSLSAEWRSAREPGDLLERALRVDRRAVQARAEPGGL